MLCCFLLPVCLTLSLLQERGRQGDGGENSDRKLELSRQEDSLLFTHSVTAHKG